MCLVNNVNFRKGWKFTPFKGLALCAVLSVFQAPLLLLVSQSLKHQQRQKHISVDTHQVLFLLSPVLQPAQFTFLLTRQIPSLHLEEIYLKCQTIT
jgi:hypothetical protein